MNQKGSFWPSDNTLMVGEDQTLVKLMKHNVEKLWMTICSHLQDRTTALENMYFPAGQ